MKLKRYLEAMRFRFNRYPSHLIFFVTGRCNARCNHCFYWNEIKKADKAKELSLEEIEKISSNFGHIKLLSITGGEPSLRDDLPEIVHTFYKNNKVDNLVFHTNGFLIEKIKHIVKRIVTENPSLELNLSVSIDALNEGHDSIRGITGGFEKAKKTIMEMVNEKENFGNLNVTINTCFSYFNQDTVKEMIDYFFNNFDIDGYYVALVRGNSMDEKAREVDINKYRDVVNYLNKKNVIKSYYKNYPLASFRRTIDFLAPEIVVQTLRKKRMIHPCKAGQSVVVVSERGEVYPCEMLTKSFGNLREYDYDIKKILFSKNGKLIKSFIKNKKCYCTWECAIMNNIVFNWSAYPRLIVKWVELELKKHFGK